MSLSQGQQCPVGGGTFSHRGKPRPPPVVHDPLSCQGWVAPTFLLGLPSGVCGIASRSSWACRMPTRLGTISRPLTTAPPAEKRLLRPWPVLPAVCLPPAVLPAPDWWPVSPTSSSCPHARSRPSLPKEGLKGAVHHLIRDAATSSPRPMVWCPAQAPCLPCRVPRAALCPDRVGSYWRWEGWSGFFLWHLP